MSKGKDELTRSKSDIGEGDLPSDKLRGVFDTLPFHVFWKDREFRYLGCNAAFARAAGLSSPDEVFGKTDYDLPWRPEEADFYRTCDRRVMETDTPEYHIVESEQQASGRQAWVDTTKVPLHDPSGHVIGVLGIYEDITDRVEDQLALRRRGDLFEALGFAAESFLLSPRWQDCIEPALARLGEAADVSRVYLFETSSDGEGSVCSQRWEWLSPGASLQAEAEGSRLSDLFKPRFGRWVDELGQGHILSGPVRLLPEQEREWLEQLGILSLAAAPIFVGGRWWGFIGFDDRRSERAWSPAEIDVLRTAAGIVGAAIRRYAVEAALRLEKTRSEQLFENTPLAMAMLSEQDRVIRVNSAFERLFGYTQADAEGRPINELVVPQGLEAEASGMSRRSLTGIAVEAETVRRSKAGEPLLVDVFGVPVLVEGRAVGVYGIYVDQTGRKRAEKALRDSEEKFRSLAEQSLQGIFVLKGGRVVFANRMLATLSGWSIEEMQSWGVRELIAVVHPGDRSFVADSVRAIELGEPGASPQIEYRMLTRDGEVRWVLQDTRQIRFEGGPAVEGVMIDITQRKRAEEQLLHSALHDPVTGLPNRALFYDRLEVAITRMRARGESRFAVLILDLDRFKVVNDSLGHASGDELLVAVTRRLEGAVYPGDTVARLGGDEYAVLLDESHDVTVAVRVAERLRRRLAEPFAIGGTDVFVTVSIGIAFGTPAYSSPSEVLRDADTALHRAKALGRDRHQVFDPDMHTRAVELLRLETDLRRAIERKELRLHYQPIVSLRDGSIVSFEALLRWLHPERGLLAPASFMSLAEETGLILTMGEWVLSEACRQARTWERTLNGRGSPAVSVNLFSRELTRPGLVDFVAQVLGESKLNPNRLELEITESAIIEDPERVIGILSRLRDLGVRVNLDDFGTGYSSLSYLQRFAVDALKIDRSFVSKVGVNGAGTAIVRAIVTLAHSLGMGALAEGVETEQQLTHLRELGCDHAQGFYFSKAVDPEQATGMITKGGCWG